MNTLRRFVVLGACCLLVGSTALAAASAHLNHGRFKDIRIFQPAGAPKTFAIFLSGDDGWTAASDGIAQRLAAQGALVAGVDWPSFRSDLQTDGDQCVFPDGDLENLSHFVQAYYHAPAYLPPMLVGTGAGGSLAYAMLVQAPANTFAAALTLGFCPSLDLEKPLCRGSGLEFASNSQHGGTFLPAKTLGNPWVVLQNHADRSCPATTVHEFVSKVHGGALVTVPNAAREVALSAAFDSLAAHISAAQTAPPPASLSDLPVVEVPAAAFGGGAAPDLFAILMSGDGGWAGLDQEVAGALAAKGIPVVGLDSLRYYWTARTPAGLASDTDRMIRYYQAHFAKHRVLLIGYSQGADVLPFAVNRLPDATRSKVGLVAVMGMSEHALFEFHVSSWVADDNSGPATLPEIDRIAGIPVLCIYGEDEKDSLCPKLDAKKFGVVKLKGGHHFDGDYAGLAREIISAAKP
jgi:type IV secretory pathway VirJ component